MKHKFTFAFEDTGEGPQVFRELENISCSEGQTAVLECQISGEPAPSAAWSRDDTCLEPETDKYTFEEHDKIYRLYIHDFTYYDAGTYRCTATNKMGQVESVADVRVFEGDTLRFNAEVFGLPSPDVKWFRNKTQLVPDNRTTIERDGDNISLEIRNLSKADQGEYICEAVNYVGEAKSVALVVVISQEARMIPAPKLLLGIYCTFKYQNVVHKIYCRL
uniref:Ig-like domain-containing protein n=1 Tax=Astyanax mexicanus TaxID=7994 RepID=A0A3B1K6K2_ASTMX